MSMSIKSELTILIHDDVESGQCSEDEVRFVKQEKRLKKHKKKEKSRKRHKRKHSSCSDTEKRKRKHSICSDSDSSSEFFNPYCVNREKYILKSEAVEEVKLIDEQSNEIYGDITGDDIISDTFKNLSQIYDNSHVENDFSVMEVPSICLVPENGFRDSVQEFQLRELLKRRENECSIDMSGIDTVTSDLFHYLMDLGLSQHLVHDILQVLSREEVVEQENVSNFDKEHDYEEEMINDIPMIEHSTVSDNCCYSPERAREFVEPYQTQQPKTAYAPSKLRHTPQLLINVIDPLSIPAVGPRDPRLSNSKTLLQMKQNQNKSLENANENLLQQVEINPMMAKEWETTVINVVKTHLRLYLIHNDINKEEYKSILKRAVCKILSSGEKKLETDKISKFLHSYVTVTQKNRIIDNV